MERVGAGNLSGVQGNANFDSPFHINVPKLSLPTDLRGRQESPFEAGARSFLPASQLRLPVDETGETSKFSDKAILGEVLKILQQIVALVEQIFVGKNDGASSTREPPVARPAGPSKNTSPTEAAKPAESTGVLNERAILGEILGLLMALIELLEKKFGNADDTKGNNGVNDKGKLSAEEKEILAQVLDLVAQIIELIQQKLGGGYELDKANSDEGTFGEGAKPVNARDTSESPSLPSNVSGNSDLLVGIQDIKNRLEAISERSDKTDVPTDEQSVRVLNKNDGTTPIDKLAVDPVAPGQPSEFTKATLGGDKQILGEILSILSQIVSFLQMLGGADKKADA